MPVESGSCVEIAVTATYPDRDLFDTASETVATKHVVAGETRFRLTVI